MAVSSTAVHVAIKLVLGGINYLFCKLALDLLRGEDNAAKPGLLTLSAFLSLFIVGLPLYAQEVKTRRAEARKDGIAPASFYTWTSHALCFIPGIFEFIALYLSMSGNSILPATIMVFMKATRVLWSALLSIFFLGRKLYGYHWVGVALTFVGLFPIIWVQAQTGQSNDADTIKTAMALASVFACEFFRAIRVILEENLMKEKHYSPEFVQYAEGYSGLILSILALILLHAVGWENSIESMELLATKPWGTTFFVLHTLAHGLVNFSSNVVTKLLSSVHNAIISEMRIIVVWGPEFLIGALTAGYALKKPLGKVFTPLYLVDIPGFMIITASAFIYSGKLKVPMSCLYPKESIVGIKDVEKVASPTTNDCCSEKACTH